MSYTILMDGDPLLRQRSAEVTEFGGDLDWLVQRMIVAMSGRNARGLAAVQIGVLQRVIVGKVGATIRWMVNPVIIRTLRRETVEREGCLSVLPRHWREVSRPAKCELAWQNLDGKAHAEGFAGEWARILLHEIDHLDGVLITDKPAP